MTFLAIWQRVSKAEPNALASGYLEGIASDNAPVASANGLVRVVLEVLSQTTRRSTLLLPKLSAVPTLEENHNRPGILEFRGQRNNLPRTAQDARQF
jgi:hypothetical protein